MDRNGRFMFKTFRKYYRYNMPTLPDRFTKREFGFMFFDKDMVQRHMGFKAPEELKRFMSSSVPSHSYYSTAYYRRPDAPTMEEKGWLGAELIFDLDADHLEGAASMSYSEMLVRIREEMITLVDSFLFNDLGFDERDVNLTFSGGRGYHAHIPKMNVLSLGTQERRELVDFITCTGLNIDWVFPVKTTVISTFKDAKNTSDHRLIPPEDSGGWRRRMRDGLKEVVDDFLERDAKELKSLYPSIKGVGNDTLRNMCQNLKDHGGSIFKRNNMAGLTATTQKYLIQIMATDVAPRLSGEVDKPVTPDIKRLIRLPGTVHGKSGLRVTSITRDELTRFDPLESAIPNTYTDEPTKVTLKRGYEFDMNGQHFSLEGETEVPEFAAVFLVGRKVADIGYLSEHRDSLFD